jgi:hypothetical protein
MGIKFRVISFAEIVKCPRHNLSPNHWIPEHKTEECDRFKLAAVNKFIDEDKARVKRKIARIHKRSCVDRERFKRQERKRVSN